jgi:hypothetical protein
MPININGKLRIKGVGQISIPVPNFIIDANFGGYATQDSNNNYFNWGVQIKPITNFTESTNLFLFGSPIVDFTQPMSNSTYNVDTTLFNVDEYYVFTTYLQTSGKNANAIFQGNALNNHVFKYNGTIENKGSYFLEFTYYTWGGDLDFLQWVTNDRNIITTEDTDVFASFGVEILGGGGGRDQV